MASIFLDTDVILDFLLDREPFALNATRILSLCEKKEISACTTGLVMANVYYILRKFSTHKKITERLLQLSRYIDFISLPGSAVINALQSDFNDFEDALQYFSASASAVEIIITQNVKDFKNSSLSVQSPEMFLRLHQ